LLLTNNPSVGSTRNGILCGLVIGLSALNRPQIIGFVPFLLPIGYLATRSLKKTTRWILVAGVVIVATLMPWLVRNKRAMGGWFPVSLQGGTALYMGNNPYTQKPLDSLWRGGRGWYDDPRMGAELQGPTPLATDRKAFHLAIAFISEHPGRTLVYSIEKAGLFFLAFPNVVSRLTWYPVLMLSLVGFVATYKQWRRLLPIYLLIIQTLLTATVFTSTPRFRAPVEPLFVLMATYAIWHVFRGPLEPSKQSQSIVASPGRNEE
jgi:hypothetical protein